MHKPANITPGVQLSICTIADGTTVTDPSLVCQVIADMSGFPGWLPEVEEVADGVWMVELPTELYQEAEQDGGVFTHSAGYVVEIPMP